VSLFTFALCNAWAMALSETIFKETLKPLSMIMSQTTAGGIVRAGSAMAVTVIMMIPPIMVYIISQRNVIEAMNSAGIKE